LAFLTSGLEGIQRLADLDKRLNVEKALTVLCEHLTALYDKIRMQPMSVLTIAEDAHLNELNKMAAQRFTGQTSVNASSAFSLGKIREHTKSAWIVNAQVNYCALAFATVPGAHPDAPALTVLGHFLRNEFLHSAVREKGGAYGSGASQNNGDAVFRFYSYRDPRLEDTLLDFKRSVEWFLERDHETNLLEQAILGVVSSLDKPRSPAGEAKHAYHSEWFGRGEQYQDAFRRGVLTLGAADLKRVASTYLLDKPGSVAVVSGEGCRARLEALGLQIHKLRV
jgi:Zn-dependent M16 (insulinase) family peptidase